MSSSVPPMLLMRKKPRTPKVEGNIRAMDCQIPGMLGCGHEIPVMNNKGIEVKTTRSITFSRYLTIQESAIPKKITAKRNGIISPMRSVALANAVKWKKRGTQSVR